MSWSNLKEEIEELFRVETIHEALVQSKWDRRYELSWYRPDAPSRPQAVPLLPRVVSRPKPHYTIVRTRSGRR